MLLAEVAATSARVAATSARSAKIAALAELLRATEPDQIEATVGFVTGTPRQGRIGLGWATVGALDGGSAAEATLTVAEVDAALSELATVSGAGSAATRTRLLGDLFSRATAAETEFLRQLLLGNLRQGALEGVVTEAIARAADVAAPTVRRAAMLGGDLGRTAVVALSEGGPGLAAVRLEVLRPVLPMLASTASDVADAMGTVGPASVEWKLDGVRVQVHLDAGDVRIFTRNLNDVTHRLPDVVERVRGLPAQRAVLDGELIGLHEDDVPLLFQDTMGGFGREDASTRPITLTPWFFDALHVDGLDLIDLPLRDRQVLLARVAGALRIPTIVTEDAAVAEAFADGALAAGHEGVMVKGLDSRYEAGRRGKAWRKVKPVKTLDLVVLAAEWGHGRRRGWLSNLHLGARDAATGGFVMVGKTFKGLTDEVLGWQTERLQAIETERHGIEVHVRPELVVEIALDGVQVSTRYPGGVALRFARVKRYRPDKAPADADTIDAVRALLPGSPP